MFAQVEKKSKPNVYENMTASTKRAASVSGTRFKAFFVSLQRPRSGISYSPNLPAAETKFTFEQSEQTLETRRPFVFHEINITA